MDADQRLVLCNTLKDQVSWVPGWCRAAPQLVFSLACQAALLLLDKSDPKHFDFEHDSASDDYLSLVPRRRDVRHSHQTIIESEPVAAWKGRRRASVSHGLDRLLSVDYSLILRPPCSLARARLLSVCNQFRQFMGGGPRTPHYAGWPSRARPRSPNHANALEGSWPYVNHSMNAKRMSPLEAAANADHCRHTAPPGEA
jgi:hypothetical protein